MSATSSGVELLRSPLAQPCSSKSHDIVRIAMGFFEHPGVDRQTRKVKILRAESLECGIVLEGRDTCVKISNLRTALRVTDLLPGYPMVDYHAGRVALIPREKPSRGKQYRDV